MAHTMPSQHDAEEAMRPPLRAVFIAQEDVWAHPRDFDRMHEAAIAYRNALDAALELLGVPRD